MVTFNPSGYVWAEHGDQQRREIRSDQDDHQVFQGDEGRVERERICISSQDSIHMFNHSLIFLSDLRSNMVNTDLLPAAP